MMTRKGITAVPGASPSIFERAGEQFGGTGNMVSVDLKLDCRFFLFQGVSQHRQHVVDGSAPAVAEMVSNPLILGGGITDRQDEEKRHHGNK